MKDIEKVPYDDEPELRVELKNKLENIEVNQMQNG